MKRTISVVLVASFAAATVPVVAQEGMPPASEPRFTRDHQARGLRGHS